MPKCKICNTIVSSNINDMDDTNYTWICLECSNKGYSCCKHCKEWYDSKKVNYNDFHLYDDISDVPSKFKVLVQDNFKVSYNEYQYYKASFCSNKHYNLSFWKDEIMQIVNDIRSDILSGLTENMKPLQGYKPIKSFNMEESIELENYINKKIKYIEENL